MSKLLEFLDRLGGDTALRKRYREDPEGTMRECGLSEEECAMVRKGDIAAIRKAVGREDVYFVMIIWSDDF
ncbi:MAG: hypothetical protein Tsb008_12030 [Rhodothalassiaceae bacterium]